MKWVKNEKWNETEMKKLFWRFGYDTTNAKRENIWEKRNRNIIFDLVNTKEGTQISTAKLTSFEL